MFVMNVEDKTSILKLIRLDAITTDAVDSLGQAIEGTEQMLKS